MQSVAIFTPDTVNVDVIVSGLGQPPSVGAFDLDVTFNAALFSPIGVTFGPFLGDPLLGDALTSFSFSSGLVDLASLSLLTPATLEAIQLPSMPLDRHVQRRRSGGAEQQRQAGRPDRIRPQLHLHTLRLVTVQG